MSEEILNAHTQLFALITKQDGGASEVEREFAIRFFQERLDQESVKKYTKLFEEVAQYGQVLEVAPMSVKESVKVLKFCKEINQTLEQKQKVLVLVKLLELVIADKKKALSPQKRGVIDAVSQAFNLPKEEFKLIEKYVLSQDSKPLNSPNILIASSTPPEGTENKYIHVENLDGEFIFMRVPSVDMYFVKYNGQQDQTMNGFPINAHQVYQFSNGSTIRTHGGAVLYYSDIISNFLSETTAIKLSFNAFNIEFRFPNGTIGLHSTNIFEGPGKLIGIMGGSGAGKTTLLNVLAGLEKPSKGKVVINGYDLHKDKKQVKGVIGYVAQDDLLIEELTVYQNLYYNAKLCFKGLSEKEIDERVMKTLKDLGLDHIKDIRVGNVLNKKISGGQRKRLNIALELIREPAVMFVDEPTSGLSSRDSENVIDLLKELSLKGKLIFVVIHQPSSDIYKMFDKMIFLDKGGYQIYYGNPINAVIYFKTATNQIDKDRGQCPTCGNVNPEQIFNIIEAEVVNEYGQFIGKRKTTPQQWHERFNEEFEGKLVPVEEVKDNPPVSLNVPNRFVQTAIFTIRDFLAKISNTQYLLLNLLEAPILAVLMSYIIRFQNDPATNGEEYMFRYNDNVPAYMLICIIIALFMGLTVSAEEIIKDRKIQKREAFLNLSRTSYLFSKLIILFTLSAIQTFSFVLIGNLILEIKGELWSYWLVLFSASCFANVLGLNISSTFNSVITIYITIPLLLIPQMILSGLIFRYEKMNKTISEIGKVPLVADFMTSRWAFEAIAVTHFKNNLYEIDYYDLEQKESYNRVKDQFWVPMLQAKVQQVLNNLNKEKKNDSIRKRIESDLELIKNEIKYTKAHLQFLKGVDLEKDLTTKKFNADIAQKITTYLDSAKAKFVEELNKASEKKEKLIAAFEKVDKSYKVTEYKNKYYNEGLAALVRNLDTKEPMVEHKGRLYQQIDPIYHIPNVEELSWWNYRTHFFAPKKHFFGQLFDTYFFNIVVIWLLTFVLYVTLYFDFFKKVGILFTKLPIKLKK
ncbi:MAG: ATP-binding cassette domain-containing protein [Microscillaceae bacterium]|nr:ATP-binding cassette domain-containing protein [Microscillaceae bacterium]MDW8460612.1 ATP-binding cassette domain-containing protein [Cytophagales bacterium]